MKKLFSLVILGILISTCNSDRVPVESPKKTVNAFLEKYHKAFNNKDINTIESMLADNGLYCGTNSKQLLVKDSLLNMLNRLFADTSINTSYQVYKREIKLTNDGKAAVAMEQFTIHAFSQNIPMRFISHIHKHKKDWKFDFGNYSYVPNDAGFIKQNKALE